MKPGKTINSRLAQVRYATGQSPHDFAVTLGISRGFLDNIEAGRKKLSLELALFLIENLSVAPDYIMTGRGPIFLKGKEVLPQLPPTANPSANPSANQYPEEKTKRTKNEVLATRTEIIVATQDTAHNATFSVVNHKAAANFITGYQSQEYFEHLGAVTLPRHLVGGERQGLFYQIEGDSMETKFSHGDWVACTLLERGEWDRIVDLDCYVVVSRSYGIQFKRIKNRLRESGFIRCRSDNRNHAPFSIDEDDILQLYRFVLHVSADASNPNEDLYKKVEWVEDITGDLRGMYEDMRQRLEQLESRVPATTEAE